MSEIKTYQLSDAVKLRSFTDSKFKTMRISVNMLLPISKLTAAKYALLPSLVSRASRNYPDYTSLGCKLAQLYGASLGSGVQKLGEYRVLTISAGGIASRYAFGGEDMFAELSQLLFSVILDPLKDAGGLFPQDGFDQEKRQQLEQKDTEFSDKMLYTHQRCHQILFEGQRAGVERLGSREDIAALKREELSAAWEEVLHSARFEIFTLGDCQPDVAAFCQTFSGLGRAHILGAAPYKEPEKIHRVTEEQPVSQSKLSLAFRVQARPEEALMFHLVSAVLGEPTSSKLFHNLREKQGLCYYCDSSFSWSSGALFIESGVETENLDRVETAVMEQVHTMQKGQITDKELEYAKGYIFNSLRGVTDSLHKVENWYLSRAFDQEDLSPKQAMEKIAGYTVGQVTEAANQLKQAVIYRLKGNGAC